VRATPPGARTGAAYLTIENRSGADRLLGAASPAARALELHTHVSEGGVQRMVRLMEVEIPAGATVAFAPGGLHVMLIDLAAPLAPGGTVALRLEFANAEPIEVSVPVIDARTTPAPAHAGH
jgi:copper(I)-binding protein